MSPGFAFRALSSAVLVMFLAGNVFAEAAAMLEPTGMVLVNQSKVNRISTVFSGDTVHTGSDSGALVSGRGNTVLLASNSAMTIGSRSVALDQGGASMTMAVGGSAQVGDLTLTPSEGPVAYDVTRTSSSVDIKVKTGKLLVARGGVVTPLTAGSHQMFQNANANSNANNDNGDNHNKRAVVAGIIVAVAAGLIVWFTTGETSHSTP